MTAFPAPALQDHFLMAGKPNVFDQVNVCKCMSEACSFVVFVKRHIYQNGVACVNPRLVTGVMAWESLSP